MTNQPAQPAQPPVSPLRRRMLEDMAMRGLREHTQRDYIRCVKRFANFLGRSPDTATADDVRRYQVHQHETGAQPPTINSSVSALRCFFTITLDRPDLSRRLLVIRHPLKLPDVLSVEEVARLLEAAPGAKYKAALGTAYGAGAGTTKGREPRLVIAGHYPHQWRDYAEIDGSGGRLRYLYIPIEPFITMKKDLHG